MAISYTDEAEADLMAIFEFGMVNDLSDPIGHVLEIRDRIETLHAGNARGKKSVAVNGAHEWVVPPYVVYYRQNGIDAEIARILHSSRNRDGGS